MLEVFQNTSSTDQGCFSCGKDDGGACCCSAFFIDCCSLYSIDIVIVAKDDGGARWCIDIVAKTTVVL